MCPRLAYFHRSKKLSIARMIVAETPLSRLLLISPVCTVPSFSYNRPAQLQRTYNYVLIRVLIQVTIINNLPLHTQRDRQKTITCRHIFPRSILFP
ncbi:unnamed protein product [Hymenolepis diminuta]|uniref:Uncharacterized protein n=1 Tax=Hymenolepis diminuta TaxID=6216 RepID=A0A564Z4Y6_HYMDI|nr:unnamed protein product [Hymenolepis diminuta]